MAKRKRRRTKVAELGQTRKDFVAVANILCHHDASAGLREAFADHFQERNPRFDKGRFLSATRKC